MTHFESLVVGQEIMGKPFAPTRETIREFCDASLDYNPLHLDDNYMKSSFGKTSFGGIIMHGMTNFGLLTGMLTDWAYAHDAVHRRLETRWRLPVKPGDVITHVVLGTQGKPATAALLKQLEQKLARGGGGRLVIVRDGYQLILTLG